MPGGVSLSNGGVLLNLIKRYSFAGVWVWLSRRLLGSFSNHRLGRRQIILFRYIEIDRYN